MADRDRECARVDAPLVSVRVVVSEGASVERDGNVLRFSWMQADACEAFQFFQRTRHRRMCFADVDLGYIATFALSGVGHVERNLVTLIRPVADWSQQQVSIAKCRVREAVAEGEERLGAGVLVSSIADENAFFVNHARAAGLRVVAAVRGIVFPAALKADGHAAGGAEVPENNLGESRATLLAGIPRLEQGGNAIEPGIHVHATAGSNHDDGVLVCGCEFLNQLVLSRREAEGAIGPFALGLRVEAYRNNNSVRRRGNFFRCGIDVASLANNSEPEAATEE